MPHNWGTLMKETGVGVGSWSRCCWLTGCRGSLSGVFWRKDWMPIFFLWPFWLPRERSWLHCISVSLCTARRVQGGVKYMIRLVGRYDVVTCMGSSFKVHQGAVREVIPKPMEYQIVVMERWCLLASPKSWNIQMHRSLGYGDGRMSKRLPVSPLQKSWIRTKPLISALTLHSLRHPQALLFEE